MVVSYDCATSNEEEVKFGWMKSKNKRMTSELEKVGVRVRWLPMTFRRNDRMQTKCLIARLWGNTQSINTLSLNSLFKKAISTFESNCTGTLQFECCDELDGIAEQ